MNVNATPTTEEAPVLLSLPKTGLQVQGGDLVKLGSRGAVVMRLPLADIESVRFGTTFESFSLIFLGMGCGLGVIAYFAWPNEWLSYVLCAVAVLLIGFALIGWVGYRIFIHAHGEEIGYFCNDLPE